MKAILILGNTTENVCGYIRENLSSSIEILKSYDTVDNAYIELSKIPIKCDYLIFNDDSIEADAMQGISTIKKLLVSDYFVAEDVMHLSRTGTQYAEYSRFVLSEMCNLSIFVNDTYTIKTIIDTITGKQKSILVEDDPIKYMKVIRKRVNGKDVVSLKENSKNRTVIIADSGVEALMEKLERHEKMAEMLKDRHFVEVKQMPPITDLQDVSIPQNDVDMNKDYSVEDIGTNKTKRATVYLVAGERKSGKTVATHAFSKSASHSNKVLEIDLSFETLGLSYFGEVLKEDILNIEIGDFIQNLSKSFDTFENSDKAVNMLSCNLATKNKYSEYHIVNIITAFMSRFVNMFDIIILDMPLSKYSSYITLMDLIDYIMITIPLYLTNVVSTGYLMRQVGLSSKDSYDQRLIVIPPNMTYEIAGVPKSDVEACKMYLKKLISLSVRFTPEIKINSFNLDNQLYTAITKLIES